MKRELTNILVKNVESRVNSKTNDGTITVQYIADKSLGSSRLAGHKKTCEQIKSSQVWVFWLPGLDLNQRPIG